MNGLQNYIILVSKSMFFVCCHLLYGFTAKAFIPFEDIHFNAKINHVLFIRAALVCVNVMCCWLV